MQVNPIAQPEPLTPDDDPPPAPILESSPLSRTWKRKTRETVTARYLNGAHRAWCLYCTGYGTCTRTDTLRTAYQLHGTRTRPNPIVVRRVLGFGRPCSHSAAQHGAVDEGLSRTTRNESTRLSRRHLMDEGMPSRERVGVTGLPLIKTIGELCLPFIITKHQTPPKQRRQAGDWYLRRASCSVCFGCSIHLSDSFP